MVQPTTHAPGPEGRTARAGFAVAFMSDTKWRKLFDAVRNARRDLDRMTVKFIDADAPRQMHFPPSLVCPRPYMDTIEFGPVALRSIEWVEFRDDLSGLLQPIGQFPLTVVEAVTRITGYTDPFPANLR